MSQTLLVTGGAGFIGSSFVHRMLADHQETTLVVVDLLTYAGSRENLAGIASPDRVVFVRKDIRDRAAMTDLFDTHRPDAVVHFAAESHVDRSIDGPEAFITTNVLGTYVLLDVALHHWRARRCLDSSRFLHVSTDEVYGSLAPDAAPSREGDSYEPNSPYAASKAGADHLVRAWYRTFGLPVLTTHCSNNYGPRQHGEKFIPTVIRSCASRTSIPLYGDGRNVRDWLHVEDHCLALDLILQHASPGSTWNIGGDDPRENIDVAREICSYFDVLRPGEGSHHELITLVTDRPGHDRRYDIDSSRLEREFEWTRTWTFEEGIRATTDWYLQHSGSG